ncbi:ABC transporter permease [Metallosphaera tengchongensis]|uniref:ABC transporter permease n=1 Tax=Metallosphaera tengchongensis TaxID=1532350 RepID=A0A6N0NUH4_9CREN|nr:ABC transporter permease [Metallosphaera tengchongensis]QKQ99127.1 ABC transporter permease [Metallosphaera tengchongensis]
MKSLVLVVISILLVMLGITLSIYASQTQRMSVVSYGFGSVAYPPNYQDQYWAVLSKGSPTGQIVLNGTDILNVSNISPVKLNSSYFYVYVVTGYVENLAPLSLLGILLVFTGTAMGFRGTVLLVQEKEIGNLAKSEIHGSVSNYILKRVLSFLVSILIVSTVTAGLEIVSGEGISKVASELLTFNFGYSRHFSISVDSLLLTSLPYTSMLSGISFALSVYLGSYLAIRSVTQKGILSKIISKWKYVGNALASWVIALTLIYAFHLRVENGESIVFPIVSLFFPFVGTFANRLFLPTALPNPIKAKGLSRSIIIYRHVLGNASVVALSTISTAFIDMLISEFLVESIFYWPGLGLLLRIGALYGDFKLIEGVLIFYSSIVLLSGLIGDIFYGFIDPRVRR